MIVHVTQSHIDLGTRENGRWCPIALAVNEAAGPTEWLVIGTQAYGYLEGVPTVRVPIAAEAQEFARRFDAGEPVSPFDLEFAVQ